MNCTNCGACCLDETVPIRPWKGDNIPPQFVDDEGCLKKVDGHCVFFDTVTRQCGNYEHRPSLCRSLAVGCGRCHISRLWAEVELNWFSKAARMPKDGSFEKFYARVQHEPNSLAIVNIKDMTQDTQTAVTEFNAQVLHVTEW